MKVLKGSLQLNKENTQLNIQELIDTMNTMIQFLYANSPRIDAANRMAVNNSEVTQPVSGTVAISGGTLTNVGVASVTTVGNVSTLSGQPQQFTGQDVPLYLYDNIKIT